MTRRAGLLATALAAALAATAGAAQAPSPMPDGRRSGFLDMGPNSRAMQADDMANPGLLWAAQGEQLWSAPPPGGGLACSGCHGDARASMAGVAARYPAFDEASRRPIDLAGRIDQCRTARQGAASLRRESQDLVALATYVALQSRGRPITPPDDPRLRPFVAEGEALFTRRQGQVDLSCADCHDAHAGRRLAGNVIPQAHPTGYPLYRLEWQAVGSLQRRLRTCLTGVRAEAWPYGAPDYVALELFLMRRAAGMPMEAPAVRP